MSDSTAAAPAKQTLAEALREMVRPKAAEIEKDVDFNAPGGVHLGRDLATFDPLRMTQLDTFTRAVVGAVIILTLVGAWAKGLEIELGDSIVGLVIAAVMATIALVYTRWRPAPRLAAGATMIAEQMVYGVIFIFFSYVAVAFGGSERGPLFARIDAMLGFDWHAYRALIGALPDSVQSVLLACYKSIGLQNMLLPAFLIACGFLGQARLFMNAYALGCAATMLIAMLAPAIDAGGLYMFDALAKPGVKTGLEITDHYMSLRAGALRTLDFAELTGIISFPSFHTYLGCLYAFCVWRLRRLRWFLLPVNALLIIGTPKFGFHYLVDVIAGFALAVLILGATHAWLRRSRLAIAAAPAG